MCTKNAIKVCEKLFFEKIYIFAKTIDFAAIMVYNVIVDVRLMAGGCNKPIEARLCWVISAGVCPIFNRALSIRYYVL